MQHWIPLSGAKFANVFGPAGKPGRKNRRQFGRQLKARPKIEFLENRITPDVSASLAAVSLASATPPNAAVGEIVRVRVVGDANLSGDYNPAGINISANMPAGLQFLPGTADIALMSDQGMVSTLNPSNAPGLNVVGSDPTGVHPTFLIPPSAITTDPVTGAMVFNTGISHVNDNDANSEFVIIEYNALVKNVASNVAVPPSDLSVNFQFTVAGQSAGVGAVPITVVEPSITNLHSNVATTANTSAAFTLTFTNTGTSTAYDVHVTDALPSGLTLNPAQTVVTGGSGLTDNSTGQLLDLTLGSVAPGGSVTITFKTAINVPANVTSILNNVNLSYTSLPGPNGTTPNPTGSTTPGAPGSATGERDGSGGINNYATSIAANVRIGTNPQPTTSIHGFVFFDANCNGHFSMGTDSPIAGVMIKLTDLNGNPVTDVNGNVVGNATTGADGSYQFVNLPVGTYRVTELPPQPLFMGAPTINGITTAGNVNGVTVGLALDNVITNISLTAGQETYGNNFGECPPNVGSISLSGNVYCDVNMNNVFDAGEMGVGGVGVHLFRTDLPGGPVAIASMSTNNLGQYFFQVTNPGTYEVTEDNVAGATKESAQPGTVNGVPTGTAPAVDVLANITLVSGDAGVNYNFALNCGGPPPNSKQQLLANIPVGTVTSPLPTNPSFANINPDMSMPKINIMAVGATAGGGPEVRVFDFTNGKKLFDFYAYAPTFAGGVNVAVGDINGDGTPDIVTAPMSAGGPHIKVFDGKTGQLIEQFMAYGPTFAGGVNLAVADVNGDGYADIITAPASNGGPNVKVFDGRTGTVIASFMAYNYEFTGGVRVTAGDFNQDGLADIVTGTGPGGGPHVKIFNSATLGAVGTVPGLITQFFAFEPTYLGGINVAANADSQGDIVGGDGKVDLVVGRGSGNSEVKIIDGSSFITTSDFLAFGTSVSNGVHLSVFDLNGDGKADIVAGTGGGSGAYVRVINGGTFNQLEFFQAFNPAFLGGVNVATA
jgi:uncharacterized repeat protein (TIGR01451 family)